LVSGSRLKQTEREGVGVDLYVPTSSPSYKSSLLSCAYGILHVGISFRPQDGCWEKVGEEERAFLHTSFDPSGRPA